MTRSEPNISQRVDEPSAVQSSFEEVMRYWHTQIHSEWGESVEFHKVDTGWYLILLYTCILQHYQKMIKLNLICNPSSE